jgi:hypothetical protein
MLNIEKKFIRIVYFLYLKSSRNSGKQIQRKRVGYFREIILKSVLLTKNYREKTQQNKKLNVSKSESRIAFI